MGQIINKGIHLSPMKLILLIITGVLIVGTAIYFVHELLWVIETWGGNR